MRTIDPEFVVQALAGDHVEWSVFIGRKHRWVNRAFVLTGFTLALFLCVGVSYVIRVSLMLLCCASRGRWTAASGTTF